MALDPNTPTTSLRMAREMLAQPESDPLDLSSLQSYDMNRDASARARVMPDFFRKMADQLGQQVQAQAEGQQAEGDQVYTQPQEGSDSTDIATSSAARFAAVRKAQDDAALTAQTAQEGEFADRMAADAETRGPELAAPSISKTPIGSFLGKIKDAATSVLAPAGHAVEKGFDVAGRAIEAMPGVSGEGEALGRIPEAAATFKRSFSKEFTNKTGQPLNFETAISAINKYGLQDSAAKLSDVSKEVVRYNPAVYTLDVMLEHTLPEWASDKILTAQDFAAGALPYIALAVIAPETTAAIGTTFALGSTENLKNLTAEYKRGHMDGKTFAMGVGMELLNIVPEVAGSLIRTASRAFKGKAELANAIRDADEAMKGRETAGVTAKTADEITTDAPLILSTKRTRQLDDELEEMSQDGFDASDPDFAALEQELEGLRGESGAQSINSEQRANLTDRERESAAIREEALASPQRAPGEIAEVHQTPLAERMGSHRLTTPEGDRLDWRETPEGAHISDVTVQVERQGTGSRMLQRAIDDARAKNPEGVITADLNSEGGARLFAKQDGMEFFARNGAPLTAEEAIASAKKGEGPTAELRPVEGAQPTAAHTPRGLVYGEGVSAADRAAIESRAGGPKGDPVPPIEQTRTERVSEDMSQVMALKAEARSITDPADRHRFMQEKGVARTHEELAIDRAQMKAGEAVRDVVEDAPEFQALEKAIDDTIGQHVAPIAAGEVDEVARAVEARAESLSEIEKVTRKPFDPNTPTVLEAATTERLNERLRSLRALRERTGAMTPELKSDIEDITQELARRPVKDATIGEPGFEARDSGMREVADVPNAPRMHDALTNEIHMLKGNIKSTDDAFASLRKAYAEKDKVWPESDADREFRQYRLDRQARDIATLERLEGMQEFSKQSAARQQMLSGAGYEHVPLNPRSVARIHVALDELRGVDSIPSFQEWQSRNSWWVGKKIDTGLNSEFRVNGKFDFVRAKAELEQLARQSGKLNDLDGSERPIADTLGWKKAADLGNCAMKETL